MGADAGVVKRFCNYMSTKERAHYLNTFKRNGKTIAENIAIDMQDILKEKFNCVVYEPMLVDIAKSRLLRSIGATLNQSERERRLLRN